MGVVYKARQRSLNRLVAVKLVLPRWFARPDSVARFRREAQAAARLRHANIVAIHEVGEEGGRHFFSMDYVEGQDLGSMIRSDPLGVTVTLAIAYHWDGPLQGSRGPGLLSPRRRLGGRHVCDGDGPSLQAYPQP